MFTMATGGCNCAHISSWKLESSFDQVAGGYVFQIRDQRPSDVAADPRAPVRLLAHLAHERRCRGLAEPNR